MGPSKKENNYAAQLGMETLPNGHYLRGKVDADCYQQHAKPKVKAALDTCSA